MNKKSILLIALAMVSLHAPMQAETESNSGNITIATYVPEEGLTPKERNVLTTMLNRMMTSYGCAGSGFDNRFIVVPKLETARSVSTGIDAKQVVEVDLALFIGDGTDGTLFASTSFTLKGIGETIEEARLAALRKNPPRSKETLQFVKIGKKRITQYYETQGPVIINTAEVLAQRYDYEGAISMLYVIPSTCSHYQQAQQLIGQYGQSYSEAQNDTAIREAQAIWAANPSEQGASEASNALARVANPTATQQSQIENLINQINGKFEEREKRAHEIELLREKNAHDENMASITSAENVAIANAKSAAEIAKEYYSRQQVVYHYHSWW